jgi:hypothetical protein
MLGPIRLVLVGLAAGIATLATLPVLLLGAPFWIVSGLAQAVRRATRPWRAPLLDWGDVIEYTPVIGWQNRPSVRARMRVPRPFGMSTDAEGWRGRSTIEGSDVVVVGDSFAFGHGVDDRHFFADLPGGVRVKALGANGYNMVQGLLWMNRLRVRLAGKLVVWFVFYGNDLLDNLHPSYRHYRTPFVRSTGRDGGWEVVTSHVTSDPWPFRPRARDWGYTDKVAEVCCASHQAERAYSAAGFLLDRALAYCDEAGATLAVIGIPDPQMLDGAGAARLKRLASDPATFDALLPDRRFEDLCARRSIPFLALSTVLAPEDHIPGDCHWTARGHERVAAAVAELHREVGRRQAEAPAVAVPRLRVASGDADR